jgi:hypothetical protein
MYTSQDSLAHLAAHFLALVSAEPQVPYPEPRHLVAMPSTLL